jgi:hypothetical protein
VSNSVVGFSNDVKLEGLGTGTDCSAELPSVIDGYQRRGTTEHTEFTEKEEEVLQISNAFSVVSVCHRVDALAAGLGRGW